MHLSNRNWWYQLWTRWVSTEWCRNKRMIRCLSYRGKEHCQRGLFLLLFWFSVQNISEFNGCHSINKFCAKIAKSFIPASFLPILIYFVQSRRDEENHVQIKCLLHFLDTEDGCGSHACAVGSTCNDTASNYTCSCAAGFTDTLCDVNIDECARYQMITLSALTV